MIVAFWKMLAYLKGKLLLLTFIDFYLKFKCCKVESIKNVIGNLKLVLIGLVFKTRHQTIFITYNRLSEQPY